MKGTSTALLALALLLLPNSVAFQPEAQETEKTAPESRRPTRVRMSQEAAQRHLVHMVKPKYPKVAKKNRIQGDVVLKAVLNKDGTVGLLRVVSGDPVLAAAAVKAVKQWRYDRYLLNGAPVEVETQVTVRFTLSPD